MLVEKSLDSVTRTLDKMAVCFNINIISCYQKSGFCSSRDLSYFQISQIMKDVYFNEPGAVMADSIDIDIDKLEQRLIPRQSIE